MPRPIIEPFRIKVVEPIRMTTAAERDEVRERARLPAMRIVSTPAALRHFTARLAPATPFPDYAG